MWAERRYSDFVCLHEEVFPVLALPEAFPVSTAVLRAPGSRTSQLQAYLITLLEKAPPPTLLAFLRPPLYAAVGVAAADCAAALPTADAAQAVALVRGCAASERVQRAGMARLRDLAADGDAAVVGELLAAGAVERLCASLRRWAADAEIAAGACAALSALAGGAGGAHGVAARGTLRRCGALELLCKAMGHHVDSEPGLVASCAALTAAHAASAAEPSGISSHYEFSLCALVCRGLAAHPAHLGCQRHGCAALHALSRRSPRLAGSVAREGGVALACRALRTFRSNGAGFVHAAALAALAALAVAAAARDALRIERAAALVAETLGKWLSDAVDAAAVHLCGWRALRALAEPAEPEAEAEAGEPFDTAADGGGACVELSRSLAALALDALRVFGPAGAAAACAAACDFLVLLLQEDLRRAVARRADLLVLASSAEAGRALAIVGAALPACAADPSLSQPPCLAAELVVAVAAEVGAPPGRPPLLTRAELGNAAALLGDALAAHGERDAAVRTHCGRALQRLKLLGVG